MAEEFAKSCGGFKRESDLVNAYLWDKHRFHKQWRRVRLGVVPTKEMAKMYMVLLRWADAIVDDGEKIIIIEAKLRPNAGAVGQLLHYKKLFRETPEFSSYKNTPIQLVLLTTMMDLAIAELCSNYDIKYVVYKKKSNK